MAPRLRSAVVRFDTLPEPVLRVIMLALPVDERARAACVCRSWRAFLADPSLWQVLDLTPAGGLAAARVTENLVRGAVARAGGQLREFSLDDFSDLDVRGLLLDLIPSDGAELQQLTMDVRMDVDSLRALLAAAPRLQALNTGVQGTCTELLPLLRNDPPYGALRVCELALRFGEAFAATDALALAAAAAAHESLKVLSLSNAHFARGLNALVDAAAERRVVCLLIQECTTDADSVSALARFLQRGSLKYLLLTSTNFPDAQEESVPVLCAALRSCRTLTHLMLRLNSLHGTTTRTVTELLDAVATLPALFSLDFGSSQVQNTAAFGRALGALLRANLPNLRSLHVEGCHLGDEGMAALLDGLAANTHLRTLECGENDLSKAFERDQLEPALAALAARAALDA